MMWPCLGNQGQNMVALIWKTLPLPQTHILECIILEACRTFRGQGLAGGSRAGDGSLRFYDLIPGSLAEMTGEASDTHTLPGLSSGWLPADWNFWNWERNKPLLSELSAVRAKGRTLHCLHGLCHPSATEGERTHFLFFLSGSVMAEQQMRGRASKLLALHACSQSSVRAEGLDWAASNHATWASNPSSPPH